MASETLNDLLLDEVKDLYDAEQQITKALPTMIKAATSSDLKDAFQAHLQQTQGHIERLEQIFKLLGEKPARKTCKAMKGLIAEGDDLIKEYDPSSLLDAALIGSAQRVEHYEIAAYGTSRAYAEALDEDEVAELLQQTLDEEKETDLSLTDLGLDINEQCAQDSVTVDGATSKPTKRSKTT